MRKELFCWGI